jgi:hypothetical protein
MNRSAWILLGLGLLIGLATGLYYSWFANPVQYLDAAPASLSSGFKEDYVALIAASYAATDDLERARLRLATLRLDDPAGVLSQLAQSRLAEGKPEFEVRALARLAAVLGERPSSLSFTPTPIGSPPDSTPSPTRPPATSTQRPTRTATATPGAPYELVLQEEVCDPRIGESQTQINILNAAGAGIPGVEILVVWDRGQDRFYTGLKPELGMGYADFTMTDGVVYSLQVSDADQILTGLRSFTCEEDGGFPGSWGLTYQQPGDN